jgi:hypothetical protein
MVGRHAFLGIGAMMAGVSGCYSYSPLTTQPLPQTRVAAVLTDVGRVEAGTQIGSQSDRVEGRLLDASDTAYVLAVSAVKPIHGTWVRWTGEQVSLRRNYVATLSERRLSKSRTAFFAGGTALGIFVAMVKLNIFGFGAIDIPIIGGGPNTGDQ